MRGELFMPVGDTSTERYTALEAARSLYEGRWDADRPQDAELLGTATAIYYWLTGPVQITVTAGPIVDQLTGNQSGNPGGTGMVAMKDSEKFELTVAAEDAKGQVTAGPTDVTFTVADTNVVSISGPDADGKTWAVAELPGSTVITADWPDSPGGDISGTLAVDVSAGTATSLVIGAGTPVPQ